MSNGSRVIIITSDPDVSTPPSEPVDPAVEARRVSINEVRIKIGPDVDAAAAGKLVTKALTAFAKLEA